MVGWGLVHPSIGVVQGLDMWNPVFRVCLGQGYVVNNEFCEGVTYVNFAWKGLSGHLSQFTESGCSL